MSLVVATVGPLALVQDAGRFGHAALGISESGAADLTSQALANRMLGNQAEAACIEVLLGGLGLRAQVPCTVVVTGAPTPVSVDGRPVAFGAPVLLPAGSVILLGSPQSGLRTYVGVRGGVDVDPVLGSRSSDPTTGIGPRPLSVGTRLPIGVAVSGPIADVDVPGPLVFTQELSLGATWGPRDDWFTAAAQGCFTRTAWTVTAQADRVGVRLAGPALERTRTGELLSEGVMRGAVQVPPDGQPVVFLSDHPTTGGYPVIGVVDDAGLSELAQARPGTAVRFTMRRLPLL